MRHTLLTLANTVNPATFELGVNFLRSEIERTAAIGSKQIVLHPGAHVGEGAEKGIKKIIEGLNEVLTAEQEVQIALKRWLEKDLNVEEHLKNLQRLLMEFTHNDKLSICFDTCHTHDSGYDIVNDFDGVLR